MPCAVWPAPITPPETLPPMIDIAAGVHADGVGLVGGQGLDLLDPGLVAVGVIARHEGIIVAVGDRCGGQVGGGRAGDHHAAGRIQRQAIAVGAAAAAQQILDHTTLPAESYLVR